MSTNGIIKLLKDKAKLVIAIAIIIPNWADEFGAFFFNTKIPKKLSKPII